MVARRLIEQLNDRLSPGQVSIDAAELDARVRDCWPRLTMRERAGVSLPRPVAVVWPHSTDDAVTVYQWAREHRIPVVPYGGGAGVCGGAAPVPGCVMIDTKRMREVLTLDTVSGIVSVQPGIIGQRLEEWLGARGWTLGHFPSSITVSSVGGFAAVRSAGQASTKYGTFPQMVAGLEAVLANGSVLRRSPRPASAAGPDVSGLLLGSEGTLGLITRLDLRVHPKPESIRFRAFRLESFLSGLEGLRTLLQRGLRPAVVRLYDEAESAAHGVEGCLLIVACEGFPPLVDLEVASAMELFPNDLGEGPAREWYQHRYDVSYRLADYLKPGGTFGDAVAVDTMEVAGAWAVLPEAYRAIQAALAEHMDVVLCHASHAYTDGACLYFTFGAAGDDEAASLRRYDGAWDSAMAAAVVSGVTTTHHHGVGVLRASWLQTELGTAAHGLLEAVKAVADPAGIANPGKLGLGELG